MVHLTPMKGGRFADMIKSYLVDLKGNQVQFNILSAAHMRAAQEHPEEYRDLVVKVAGYSAYFNSLDKGLQDQIIEERSIHCKIWGRAKRAGSFRPCWFRDKCWGACCGRGRGGTMRMGGTADGVGRRI